MALTSITKVATGDDQVYEAITADLAAGVVVVPGGSVGASGLPTIVVAGALAKNALGVSAKSCVIASNQAGDGSGTDSESFPFVDASVQTSLTTVYSHAIVPVTYTAAVCAFGAKIKSAAAGAVAAWVDGTDDVAGIIGTCMQPGGIGSGGGVGLAKISL